MQIVKRGTKGKKFFGERTKKTTSQVDIFNNEKTNNGFHLKVE